MVSSIPSAPDISPSALDPVPGLPAPLPVLPAPVPGLPAPVPGLPLPVFSVVVPTYQRNDFVAACLACLAPGVQTLPPHQYEVIVTDDGKTSSAQALIEADFAWARWHKGPQAGPGPNRNNGATHARGEWVIFVDDDCLPEPGFLQAYADAVATHRSATHPVWVFEGKTVAKAGIHSPMEEAPLNLYGGTLWSCNLMVRRDDFFAFGPFDPFFYCKEDVDFRERLRAAGLPWVFVEGALVDHPPRRRSGGHAGVRLMEYETLLLLCGGYRKSVRTWLLRIAARRHLKDLTHYRFSRDTVLALWDGLRQIGFIWRNAGKWERQFDRFRKLPPRYHYPHWL